MAYDLLSESIVLFAGYSINGHVTETWSFDGTTWTQLCSGKTEDGGLMENTPPGSFGVAAASDPGGGILVFGGMYSIGDLWRWRDGKWSVLCRAADGASPGQRVSASLCFDPYREAFILGGGAVRDPPDSDRSPADFLGWWQVAGDGWTRLNPH